MISLPATCTDPRKNDFYGTLLERTVRGLVETLGEDSLEAVLLIGAPARGEATVVDTPDGFLSLSDIDLVCVSSAWADPAVLRSRLSPWQRDLNEELRPLSKGVDVGIRTRADLGSLPALISTYEMLRSPAVLWGDPGILESLPALSVREIPLAESLTLLHNRIVEVLLLYGHVSSAKSDRPAALTALYGTAKLALDAVTAILYARRNVPAGYGGRVEVFRDTVLAGNAPLKARLADYVADLAAWARFKTEGDLDGLVVHFGRRTTASDLADLAREAWHRYARYAEVFWREILGQLTGTEAGDLGLAETASLYAGLESVPRSLARTWKLSRPGAAPDGLFSTARLLRRARFASPRERAYLTAVVAYLGLAGAADVRVADDLVRRYSPFRARIGHRSIATEDGREAVLESLSVFHETLLLGRTAGGTDGA